MPLYEYQCGRCGRFEVIRKFSDPALTECPTCGQEIQKLLSAPAIQFKGTGWYITDYARKSSGGESGKDGAGKSSSTKDGGSAKDSGGKDSSSKDSGSKDSGGKASDGASTTPASTTSTGSGTGTAKGGSSSSSS